MPRGQETSWSIGFGFVVIRKVGTLCGAGAEHHVFMELIAELGILRHREKLLNITKLKEKELTELENIVKQNITFINEHLIPTHIIEETKIQLENIDPFDVPFIALTKHLNAKLWTGDKKLYNPLKIQNFQNILSTADLSIILDEFD